MLFEEPKSKYSVHITISNWKDNEVETVAK